MEKEFIEEIYFDKIDSTQLYAREKYEDILSKGKKWYVVKAKEQTAGIGTKGRLWSSHPGNVFATFIVPWDKRINLGKVVNFTSVAVSKTLEEFGLKPKIKWVNDVMINNQKISGIMVDSRQISDDIVLLIVG